MKSQLKADWLKALRSGKYRQITGSVNGGGGYCCIGVGGKIAGAERYEWTTMVAAEAIGLTKAQMEKLVVMNDQDMKSFGQIADWIEANIPAED